MYWMFLEPNKEFYIDTKFYDLPYVQSDIFDAKIRNLFFCCFFEIYLFTFANLRSRSLLSFAHASEKYERVIGWIWKVNNIIQSDSSKPSRSLISRLSLLQKTKIEKFEKKSWRNFHLWVVICSKSSKTSDIHISRFNTEVCELEDGGCVEKQPCLL